MDREVDVVSRERFERQWNTATKDLPVVVQNKEELWALRCLMHDVDTYLEIGSSYGISLVCLGSMAREMAVFVDETKPQCLQQLVNLSLGLAKGGITVVPLFGRSDDVIKGIDREFDVVFIDGDHSYDQVKRDWENYGPLARKFVAFHDILLDDPGRLFEEIGGDLKIIGKDSEYGIGIKFA